MDTAPSDSHPPNSQPWDTPPLELRFRPLGVGRWLEALFLAVWLLGWLLGESFVLAALGLGLRSLLTGMPLPGQAGAPSLAAMLPVGAFLLVWVSFWSLGGLLAARQLLRCLWAQDRLILTASHLEWRRQLGPFRRVRRLERRAIEAVWLGRRGSQGGQPLLARVGGRQLELTVLGSLEQRRQAAEQLQQALRPRGAFSSAASSAASAADTPAVAPPNAEAAGEAASPAGTTDPAHAMPPIPPDRFPGRLPSLPEDWECLEPSFSTPLLVPARRLRRRQALLLSLLALPLDGGLLLLVRQAWVDPQLWPLCLMLTVVALAASWGALWLHLGRREWRLERRQLVAQRRFAGQVQELFSARTLVLEESSDSDGDRWYALRATELLPAELQSTQLKPAELQSAELKRAEPQPGRLPPTRLDPASGAPGRRPRSAVLCRSLHEPDEPRALGQWLARRTGIPWIDQVPSEAEREASRQAELQRLRAQLAASGRLGQWLAKRLDRLS